MRHPIPPGTRDVLADERRELRRLETALIDSFERFGYSEVQTPAIEYHEVLARGDERGAPAAYRFFDEAGELLSLRTDMTVPIARLAASRLAASEPPFRLCYVGSAYRAVRPQRGQLREFVQAGVELIGPPGPGGTVEVIAVLDAALEAVGLGRAVIGLGDALLYSGLLDELEVGGEARDRVLAQLARHDLVGLEGELRAIDLAADERRTLLRVPALRGGREVLEEARALGGAAVERATGRLSAVFDGLAGRGVAERVILDLGLV
nr:ATP phosphoribosyltransferase regulatory subunit [Solirubrobacterales bacterium]